MNFNEIKTSENKISCYMNFIYSSEIFVNVWLNIWLNLFISERLLYERKIIDCEENQWILIIWYLIIWTICLATEFYCTSESDIKDFTCKLVSLLVMMVKIESASATKYEHVSSRSFHV